MSTSIWDFVSDPAHRETLQFLGGGLAVVVGAVWVVIKYALQRRERGGAQTPTTIKADRGGIAAGRDVHIGRDNRPSE